MNRQIKFRAWDKERNCWIEPVEKACWGEGTYWELPLQLNYLLSHPEQFEVVQFTGLLDKTGKEIYEGDILHSEVEGYMPVQWEDEHAMWVIISPFTGADYDTGALIDGFAPENLGNALKDYALEIIGNIYENPDLLSITE